jgi:hypothetical protein
VEPAGLRRVTNVNASSTIAHRSAARTDLVDRLTAARAEDAILHLETYCRHPDCPAREVHLHLKDYDGDLLALIRKHGLRCPVCGPALALHWVHTRAEHRASTERDARMIVNTQLYERDHKRDDGLVLIPASVFLDDRLPATPADWWERRENSAFRVRCERQHGHRHHRDRRHP